MPQNCYSNEWHEFFGNSVRDFFMIQLLQKVSSNRAILNYQKQQQQQNNVDILMKRMVNINVLMYFNVNDECNLTTTPQNQNKNKCIWK